MRVSVRIAGLVFCAILLSGVSQAQTLDGSTVLGTLYSNSTTILGGPTSETVGASTPTFPDGSILGNTAFTINITNNKIIYDPLATVTYANTDFNGFVFDFTGAPDIINVTLDPLSTFTPTGISFTSNSVSLNLSNNAVTPSSEAILDLQLKSSAVTPEPGTAVLWLTGIGLMILARKRITHLLRLDTGTHGSLSPH